MVHYMTLLWNKSKKTTGKLLNQFSLSVVFL